MSKSLNILFFSLLCFSGINSESLYAQGCNDAGLCTIGNNSAAQQLNQPENTLSFVQTIALGEQNTFLSSSLIDWNTMLYKNISMQIRVPFNIAIGNLGTVMGLGDPSLNLSILTVRPQQFKWVNSAAIKLPTSHSNEKFDNRALPMVYQNSLGTTDLILSSNFFTGNWHFAAAYQHSFGSNANEFNHLIPDLTETESRYFESSGLKRGDDLMVRISRKFEVAKSTLFVGLLPIYRLKPDKILKNNVWEQLDKTQGLTLNMNAAWMMQFENNTLLKITAGAPLITREVRSDGLTRTFVLAVSYTFRSEPTLKLKKEQLELFKYAD